MALHCYRKGREIKRAENVIFHDHYILFEITKCIDTESFKPRSWFESVMKGHTLLCFINFFKSPLYLYRIVVDICQGWYMSFPLNWSCLLSLKEMLYGNGVGFSHLKNMDIKHKRTINKLKRENHTFWPESLYPLHTVGTGIRAREPTILFEAHENVLISFKMRRKKELEVKEIVIWITILIYWSS